MCVCVCVCVSVRERERERERERKKEREREKGGVDTVEVINYEKSVTERKSKKLLREMRKRENRGQLTE